MRPRLRTRPDPGPSPEPEPTPRGPAYQGRLLPRPAEEVVDQGAGFDVGTVLTRRRALGLFGLGLGAVALSACGGNDASGSSGSTAAAGTSTGEIPEETNGPYPADGTTDLNVLEESGIVRSDLTTSLGSSTAVAGVPLTLTFRLLDLNDDDAPLAGAALYAWHCDAEGRYSMYSAGVEDETFLRGIQVADADGSLTFTTVVPGCYAGRWPHVHFEVYPDLDSADDVDNVIATSQLALPPELLAKVYARADYPGSSANLADVGSEVADDHLFGEGDWRLQVPTVTGTADRGYTATIDVRIDPTTQPGSGTAGAPPGGMGGPPPP